MWAGWGGAAAGTSRAGPGRARGVGAGRGYLPLGDRSAAASPAALAAPAGAPRPPASAPRGGTPARRAPTPRDPVPSSQLGQKEKMALDWPPEVTRALICMPEQPANGGRVCMGPLGTAPQAPRGPCLKLDWRLSSGNGGLY